FGQRRQIRVAAIGAALFGLMALASCQGTNVGYGLPEQAPATEPAAALPEAKGEIIGNGPVRIALMLPLSAPGNAAVIARELKNSAAMAMEDWGMDTLQLVVKDTLGTPNGTV